MQDKTPAAEELRPRKPGFRETGGEPLSRVEVKGIHGIKSLFHSWRFAGIPATELLRPKPRLEPAVAFRFLSVSFAK
jgi:hypothetical protein